MSGYGRLVEIRHNDGFTTRYAHLKKMDVKLHQKVHRGQAIGRVGQSGRATTPHLHFEILTPKFRFKNPKDFL
jgi:murein DD-endopeptidase MepM/ murein hydrolase activator NlpD